MFGLITAGLGVATSIAKMAQNRKMMKQAQSYIDNFEPEPLSNKFADLQVSTLGAEMRAEEANMDFKNITEASRGGGMRGIMGMTQAAQNNKNKVMEQVGAGLDAQQRSLDVLAAKDEVRIENTLDKRKQDELAGYGNMLDVARQGEQQAIGSMVSSIGGMAGAMGGGSGGAQGAGAGSIFSSFSGSAGQGLND